MKRRVKISKDMKRKGRRAEESEHVFSHESKEAKSEETMEDQQLQFEDPFPDEFEEEVITEEAEQKETKDEDEEENEQVTRVFRPGIDTLDEGEVLEHDPSAYLMYHQLRTEWPCLSFDIVPDSLGLQRSRFPHTCFIVTGSQADSHDRNILTVVKLSELHKTKHDADSDDDDEEALDDDPIVEHRSISHPGGINRIRVMPQSPNVVSTWSETSGVHIWDVEQELTILSAPGSTSSRTQESIFSFTGHPVEGFAMDWSPISAGRLVTGDCRKHIYLWEPIAGGWNVDKIPFKGHKDSVEDLQWSPTEDNVFASCSVDRTIKIWDTRTKHNSALSVLAHDADVNVISWNRNVGYLVVSGSDDGTFKIWDLRNFDSESPVAHIKWHTAPITSVEWNPNDDSVLAVSGADDQITVWDMSLEEDEETIDAALPEGARDYPPQLLFVHQGQTDIKELHFHQQIPGVILSTAADGFNIFHPENI